MTMETYGARILRFCNRAPRTWSEIISTMAGANAERDDLPEEDAARVLEATHALWTMTRQGVMRREPVTDPMYDLFSPV